jgi:hypothetical protein
MSLAGISAIEITTAMNTYPGDQVPYFIHQALHIIVLPSSGKIDIPVAWMRLPPKCGVHSSATA